jgi:hypothetical protein
MGQSSINLAVILAARHSSSGDEEMPMWLITTIAFVIIFAIAAFFYDPKKWYGRMQCTKCGYQWESRRNTPPVRCPKCSSTTISPLSGL